MECRKPAAIDRATALRYMGASGWTPDPPCRWKTAAAT